MDNKYPLHGDQEREFKEIRDDRREERSRQITPLLYFALPTLIIIFLPFFINFAVDDIEYVKHLNFFTLTSGITFFAVALLWKAKSEGDLALNRIEESIGIINKKTAASFRELIEPLFEQFDDVHQARELLIRVFKDLQQDDSAAKEIHYIGAASIYPSDDELFELETDNGGNYDIAIKYRNIFDAIIKDKTIKMNRYFCKHSEGVFNKTTRSVELVEKYRNWLINQRHLIQISGGNYILWDALRAPAWGATKSTIISNRYIVDVYPQGAGGISIRGRSLAKQQQTKLIDEFIFSGVYKPSSLAAHEITEHEGKFH